MKTTGALLKELHKTRENRVLYKVSSTPECRKKAGTPHKPGQKRVVPATMGTEAADGTEWAPGRLRPRAPLKKCEHGIRLSKAPGSGVGLKTHVIEGKLP